jgi:hypothetical protein
MTPLPLKATECELKKNMNIIHRISLSADDKKQSELSNHGIEVPLGFASFDIDESTPSWESLLPRFREWKAVDVISTKFSRTELSNASFLKVGPTWHWDYPQPEDKRGYLTATYKTDSVCPACGCGAIQSCPFKIKGEPTWKKRKILQLNWIFDVFFCLPDIWQNIFKPFKVSHMEVLEYPTSKKLESIVQLIPQGVAICSDQLEQHPFSICSRCGTKKYLPITRGFFPGIKSDAPLHYFVSEEWFGSGASASRAVFVSQPLYRSIKNAKLTGVTFAPTLGKNEVTCQS